MGKPRGIRGERVGMRREEDWRRCEGPESTSSEVGLHSQLSLQLPELCLFFVFLDGLCWSLDCGGRSER